MCADTYHIFDYEYLPSLYECESLYLQDQSILVKCRQIICVESQSMHGIFLSSVHSSNH